MEFGLGPERVLLRDTVKRFIARKCPRDRARELEKEGRFPRELWGELAELGLLGLPVSERYRGGGGDKCDLVIVLEELARGATSLAVAYAISVGFAAKAIELLGNEDQRREYLPRIISGDALFAFALTEPSGGCDALSLRAKAERTGSGEEYVLNGTKTFITLAHLADYVITVARTMKDPPKRSKGISAFIVRRDAPGVRVSHIEKVGLRATACNEISFEDVRVAESALLGEEHNAWYQLLPVINGERTSMAAICVGLAEAALEDAMKYSAERAAFGKTLNGIQAIQHYLVDMKAVIEASRMLVWRAAWLESSGKPYAVEATMALLVASQAASKVTDLGLQIMGGYGYSCEFDMERYWRDARAFRLSPISNEMARNFIAESLGMPKSY